MTNTVKKITESVRESSNITKEPALCIFKYKGLTCVVVRNFILNYCGYVEKLYDVDICNISVHGGITFEGSLDHISEELKGKAFLGFDTCHADDLLVNEASTWTLIETTNICHFDM